jgi:3D (Asp-Asp-Asp) domain-containing protein
MLGLMRRLAISTTGLLSILLAACGSSSSPARSPDDAGVEAVGDATSGTHAGDLGDDALDGADSAPVLDSSPTSEASPGSSDADADSRQDAGESMSVYATFYGWADNSPPGGAIAYPKSDGYPTVHETAGGDGSYADPITFATDKSEFPVGTILYVPFIEKYVVMEDDCVECDSDWTSAHKWHIDLWMNSNGTENASSLASCEDRWTRTSTPVEIDPPTDRAVTPSPLFDPSTNTCRTTP